MTYDELLKSLVETCRAFCKDVFLNKEPRAELKACIVIDEDGIENERCIGGSAGMTRASFMLHLFARDRKALMDLYTQAEFSLMQRGLKRPYVFESAALEEDMGYFIQSVEVKFLL